MSERSTCVHLAVVGDIAPLQPEWTALALKSGNVFGTWEWAATWLRHFGRDLALQVLTCRDPTGRLIGVVPLYVATRRPLRVLRFLGHGPADRLAPICAPEHRDVVAEAFRRWMADSGGRQSVVVADFLPRDEGWAERLGATSLRHNSSPTVHIDATTWDGYLAARSANFREQVRARRRRLERSFDVRFRLSVDPDRLPADMAELVRLHEARWGDAGSDAFRGQRRPFHEEFARVALDRGWLRLWFLELDGRPVAAWLGFRYGDAEWYYQSGRDPAYDDRAVGFVLMAHTLRAAIDDGMRSYHLLRGDEAYKRRFATGDAGVETVAIARGRMGELAVTAAVRAAASSWGRRGVVRLVGR